MKRFSCPCGQAIFFDNTKCLCCAARLGFDPGRLQMLRITQTDAGTWSDAGGTTFRLCANSVEHDNCNWLVSVADSDIYCV
ncbi:MAG: zinc-ribbon domain-containing protein, partial [Gammaproteobacteria bacterium]